MKKLLCVLGFKHKYEWVTSGGDPYRKCTRCGHKDYKTWQQVLK